MSRFVGLQAPLRPWANELYRVAQRYGLKPRVTSVFRGLREQRALREKFLRGESRFPAAPPGRSLHNFGHAFDLHVKDAASQEWLGRVWEHWGGRWGGRFNDAPHFDSGARIPS